jgi:hypothetical protein
MPTPPLNADLSFAPVAKPFERQAFVPELAVERFVGAALPRFAGSMNAVSICKSN